MKRRMRLSLDHLTFDFACSVQSLTLVRRNQYTTLIAVATTHHPFCLHRPLHHLLLPRYRIKELWSWTSVFFLVPFYLFCIYIQNPSNPKEVMRTTPFIYFCNILIQEQLPFLLDSWTRECSFRNFIKQEETYEWWMRLNRTTKRRGRS